MQRQQERITAGVEPTGRPSELLQIAVRSWLHFMRNACHQWLDSTETSRDDVRELCAQALVATLLALPEGSRPSAIADLEG